MKTLKQGQSTFDDAKVNVKIKISALWAPVMFCYVYGDYFGLYVPGKMMRPDNSAMRLPSIPSMRFLP